MKYSNDTYFCDFDTKRIYIYSAKVDELTLCGFALNDDFESYPTDVQNRFEATGRREEIDGGALVQEVYTDGIIELNIRTGEDRYMKVSGTKKEINRINCFR